MAYEGIRCGILHPLWFVSRGPVQPANKSSASETLIYLQAATQGSVQEIIMGRSDRVNTGDRLDGGGSSPKE